MELTCMQLSIEGERALKAQDYELAIQYFEEGLRRGTDDNEILSAVYNQLGNACFYIGKFHKALEYHKKDLEIAEKLSDRAGMAKAFGNLGNTFKSLKNYPNAVRCCEAHLEIARELKDRLGEGRACYNLGNVYHAMGKSALAVKNDARKQAEGKTSINKAIEYYKSALEINVELNDAAGEGRAVGNLGNAYTAIGKSTEAIQYHQRRLDIATKANDLAAQARACGNLGNAYSALKEYTSAIRYYQQSLAVARESNNKQGVAQAYFCLGSTFGLQKNHVKALEYHEKHLELSEKLNDKTGIMRALYNLRNTYHELKDKENYEKYQARIDQMQGKTSRSAAPGQASSQGKSSPKTANKSSPKSKPKRKAKVGEVEAFTAEDSSDDDEVVSSRNAPLEKVQVKPSSKTESSTQWLNTAVEETKSQPQPTAEPERNMEFFDMLMSAQTSRLDDQRSTVPPPSFSAHNGNPAHHDDDEGPVMELAEDFFELVTAVQGTRFDDQRSAAPGSSGPRNVEPQAKGCSRFGCSKFTILLDGAPAPQQSNLKDELDEDTMSFFEMLAVAKKSKS